MPTHYIAPKPPEIAPTLRSPITPERLRPPRSSSLQPRPLPSQRRVASIAKDQVLGIPNLSEAQPVGCGVLAVDTGDWSEEAWTGGGLALAFVWGSGTDLGWVQTTDLSWVYLPWPGSGC